MARKMKAVEPEVGHQCQLVFTHRPKAMTLHRARSTAFAIPAKICSHDGEMLSETGCNPLPERARLWKAVEKEERRSSALLLVRNRAAVVFEESRATHTLLPALILLGPWLLPDVVSREGEKVARLTGLEPATPGVTGRYSNQLSYNRAVTGLLLAAPGGVKR